MESGANETRCNATEGVGSSRAPPSHQLLTSIALAALILFSILGNACVIAAVALERSLQNAASYLIGSLAVADLMVSVLVLPMAALYQVLGRWTLGQVTCDLFISLDVLCCTSSILHLCAIALDRYWAVTDPVAYVSRRTPRHAATLAGLTWAAGFSISIPPVLGWRTAGDRSDPDACSISRDPAYTVYSTFGAFYLPLAVMLVLYGRIFRAARLRARRGAAKRGRVAACVDGAERGKTGAGLQILPLAGHEASLPDRRRGGRGPEARRKAALGRERRAVKTLGIIMGTFILCWLPFFTAALVLPLCRSRCRMPGWLGDVINWLGYSNSLLNPVIYAYFNRDFRNAFKRILGCKCARR